MEKLKWTDQLQRENWLFLAICILIKLNLRKRIIDGIYEGEEQLREGLWGQDNPHSALWQQRK